MGGRASDKEWLLLKKADAAASEREAIERYPESVITGLTVEEMRDRAAAVAALRAERRGAPARREREVDPTQVAFMLATLVEKPFPSAGLAVRDQVRRRARARVARRRRAAAVRAQRRGHHGALPRDRRRRCARSRSPLPARRRDRRRATSAASPSFQRLQARMGLTKPRDIEAAMARVPVRAMFFDVPRARGARPAQGRRWSSARPCSRRVLPPLGGGLAQRPRARARRGVLRGRLELGLEGIVAKKLQPSTPAGARPTGSRSSASAARSS